jgi:hypothetical protein
MNLPYAWRCFACSEVNEPTISVCAACRFPACARGADIAAARAARETEAKARCPVVRKTGDIDSIADLLAPLPLWRRVIAVCGALASAGGCLWLKVTFSLVGVLWGIAGLVGGAALTGLAFAGHESSTSSAKRSGAT